MIREFQSTDLLDIEIGGFELEYAADNIFAYHQQLIYSSVMGKAETLVIDDKVICCFGIINLWRGVGEIWLLPSVYVTNYRKTFHKTIINVLNNEQKNNKLHRIQSVCDIRNQVTINWHKHLGFTEEGILRKYDKAGRDYIMMARVI